MTYPVGQGVVVLGEARKVQRLGQSSLIVTLPKNWVKRVGLKPGDIVYIEDEGDSLRIKLTKPSSKERKTTIDANELGKLGIGIGQLLSCLYLLGFDQVRIENVDHHLVAEARQAARRLSGVGVLASTNSMEVRSFIDAERLDLKDLVTNTISLLTEMFERLEMAVSTRRSLDSTLYEEAIRITHLVNKKLISEIGGDDPTKPAILMAMALSGQLASILGDTIRRIPELCGKDCNNVEELRDILKELKSAMNKTLSALASERLHTAVEAAKLLRHVIEDIWEKLLKTRSPREAAILARLLDATYTAIAVNGVTICVSLYDHLATSTSGSS